MSIGKSLSRQIKGHEFFLCKVYKITVIRQWKYSSDFVNSHLEACLPVQIMGRTAFLKKANAVICRDKEWDESLYVPVDDQKKGFYIPLSKCKKCEFYIRGYCQKKLERISCP